MLTTCETQVNRSHLSAFMVVLCSTSRWQSTPMKPSKSMKPCTNMVARVLSVRVFALHLVCQSDEGKQPCRSEEGGPLAQL